MNRLYFWNEWIQPYKNLYWFFFIFFALSFLYAIYNYFIGLDYVIHWELVDNLDQLKLVVHTVNVGNFKFEIPIDNYIVFQYFEGSNLIVNAYNAYIFLCLLVISVNLVMAVLPSLPKIWFYAGMGGFIGFIVLLNIDQIMLFGRIDKTGLIIVLGVYVSVGYYFKEINENVNILWRLIIFCIISFLLGILFYKYAAVSDPFLYITNYGILAPIIITILFIVFIAHEIIYGFLHLITNSNTIGSKNSLQHFTFISIFFIVYVGLTYLSYTKQINWDLIYLNPFLLAGITFILGIWGFKRRQDLFKEIFSFYPVGGLFYLGFGIISINTLSYIFANGNDPLMETFEDVILYSQIGFGFMFFIYVVTNFGPLLLKNMKVSKIVYQSRVFPFFIFRIGGLVIFGFIILSANFLSYYQAMAGYYNYIGDIFFIENRLDLAEEYYTEASVYEYQNHRSNYAMATLARLKRNKYDEAYYFDNACLKQPTEFSYVNLSNVFLHNDQYFDGLFKLKDAMEEFPNSYHILNNMGYYYSRTDISDSAFYYFEMSNNAKWKSAVPASNIYGLLAKANIDIPIDSLEARYDTKENFSGKANKLAMHNQFGSLNNQKQSIEIEDNYSKSYFAYLYNTGLHSIRSDNTKFYQDMQAYADSSGSDLYKNRIAVLTSFNRYFNHQVTESLRLLYELGEMSLLNDEYFNILGILALDLNSPRLAMDYFQRTSIQENEKYRLNLALAYAEAGLIKYSRELFETMVQSSDVSIQALSKAYLSVLDWGNIDQIDTLNDEQKYLLYRYRYKKNDPVMSKKLLASVENNMIKTLIQIENVEFLLREGKDEEAFEYFTNTNIAASGSPFATRINKLKYLSAINGKTDGTELNNPGNIDSSNPLYLYDQLLNLKMNYDASDTVLMDSIYNILATWNPFFEEGVIAAVNYFDEARNMDNYAYNMLVNALTVNTYSVILNKYYIAYCINDGLVDFARNRLEFIGNFMNGESFEEYHKTTLLEINRKEAAMNTWGN